MPKSLSQRPEREFMDFIKSRWDPTNVVGYDIQASEGAEAFVPVASSIDTVGAVYPSIIVSKSTPGAVGGETGYDFLTTNGPGQNRAGELVATIRAADEADYVGDSSTYSSQNAEQICQTLIDEVERIPNDNSHAPGTDFMYVSAHRPTAVPDDDSETPTVRLAQSVIRFGWIREP